MGLWDEPADGPSAAPAPARERAGYTGYAEYSEYGGHTEYGGRAECAVPASGRARAADPQAPYRRHGTGVPAPADRSAAGDARGTGAAPRHGAVPWHEARRTARAAARRLGERVVPLGDEALGTALARGLAALTDLPSFDSSAMDGWAVAGPGPWLLRGRVLAGRQPARPVLDGHAVEIATGAPLPPGTTAVVRSEHGVVERHTDGDRLAMGPDRLAPAPGQDTRPRGQECRRGDELLPAGALVTPAVLGLAAAAGYDQLTVVARPRVEVLVVGDELMAAGVPRDGRVRDALGPLLPSWLRALGAEVTGVRRLPDDAGALSAAVAEAVAARGAHVVVTTGGTAAGPVDHLRAVLAREGARLLVDGVAVRPGHPMLLAALPPAAGAPGALLAGLPGNPLAAVAGVLTLVAPLLRTLAGLPAPAPYTAPLTEALTGHPVDTRLVPVVFDDDSAAHPLRFTGPAMLRGLAAADGMAVVPPGGARAGEEVTVLDTGLLGPAWGGR
ncbi:molybdopterin molybdotransferase MoeA [Actinacidiphila yeochonensis]|uniref:molybdopterin molybdotransferase MoeA n=1 Tax=Actinacidiphila yeochonensis TaxID=89050 RepID=UPI00068C1821|nr:molybdopterin molybdotransferase MoeA [Actinacidiphila yeochonensis]